MNMAKDRKKAEEAWEKLQKEKAPETEAEAQPKEQQGGEAKEAEQGQAGQEKGGEEQRAALEAAVKQRDEYLQLAQRVQADFDNFRRRNSQTRADAYQDGVRETVAALLPVVDKIQPEDFAVVELSSFQLISMRQSPEIAVVTNVTPNHLDHHKDMQEYIDAKKNILLHQNAFSRTVLNAGNAVTASFAPEVRGDCWMFRRGGPVDRGVWCDGENIYVHGERLMPISQIKIPGWHNVENYMAAIAAVWGDVEPETIRQVAAAFNGVEHRAEFVRELHGVKYYNDSIATSPTRVMSGTLSLFPQKILMIAGGYDKHIPFEPLGPVVCGKVKTLILMGATAQKIEDAVKAAENYKEGAPEILRVENMEQAVAAAAAHAQPGDIVSLSPASAAFDLYPNFEVRGRHYKELVNGLQ